MKYIDLNILCNHDSRDESDIQVEKQLEELGIPIPKKSNDDTAVVSEWRKGAVMISKIEAFYPHGKTPEHTIVQLLSNSCITVQESVEQLKTLINNSTNGQRFHIYSATVS